MLREPKETVWYCAPYEEVIVTHRDKGIFYATPETYLWDFGNGPETVTNSLHLIRQKINKKNWDKAIKKGFLVKLGAL